jgi:hypothetical protein
MSETAERGGGGEHGLLLGDESVAARFGRLADDISQWGEGDLPHPCRRRYRLGHHPDSRRRRSGLGGLDQCWAVRAA